MLTCQFSRTDKLQIQREKLVLKTKVESELERHPDVDLWPPFAHKCTCVLRHTHTSHTYMPPPPPPKEEANSNLTSMNLDFKWPT